MLLGFLDQTPVYNSINFSLISHGDGNVHGDLAQVTAITTRIASLVCPSAPLPYGPSYPTYYDKPHPGNSYFASVGSSLHWVGASGGSRPNGIFMFGGGDDANFRPAQGAPPIGVRDVQDGTSNTIAFGEWRLGDFDFNKLSIPQDVIAHGPGDPPGITNDGWGDPRMNMPAGSGPFLQWLNTCGSLAPPSITYGDASRQYNRSYLGQSWNQGMFGHTLGNTLLAPNPDYPNCRMCSWDGDFDCPGMYGMSSYHPGGGNIAFADGSVRFLKSSASMQVVWALGSRAQGEVLSSDQY
jgi:prepilin-type processing-associated H-X9-DG protein